MNPRLNCWLSKQYSVALTAHLKIPKRIYGCDQTIWLFSFSQACTKFCSKVLPKQTPNLKHDTLHYIARRINAVLFYQSSAYLTWFPCWCCTPGNRFCTIPGWFNCISLGGDCCCCCCKCCPWWWTGRAVMNVVCCLHWTKVEIVLIFTTNDYRRFCFRWNKSVSRISFEILILSLWIIATYCESL